MKKERILFIMVTLSLLLVFAGCSKKSEIKQDAAVQQSTVATDQKAIDDAAAREKAAREEAARRKAMEEEAARLKAQKAAVVSPLTDIYFDFDKDVIRQQDRETLNQIAAWIKQNNTKMLTIEGHCDERGTAEYNLALGDRRAGEAKKYLTALGISAKTLNTISYGKERPLDPAHNEDAWSKNRRDHFIAK